MTANRANRLLDLIYSSSSMQTRKQLAAVWLLLSYQLHKDTEIRAVTCANVIWC